MIIVLIIIITPGMNDQLKSTPQKGFLPHVLKAHLRHV